MPFSEHLGLRVEHAEAAHVTLELRPEHLNNHAGSHGGVVMSLLDSAMAHAALSRVDYVREVVTVDMHIAFMRPAQGRLVAEGRASGGGRSVCFCEATLTDESGEIAARAMGTPLPRSGLERFGQSFWPDPRLLQRGGGSGDFAHRPDPSRSFHDKNAASRPRRRRGHDPFTKPAPAIPTP